MQRDNLSPVENDHSEPNLEQLGLNFFRAQEARLEKEKPGNKNMFEIAKRLFLNLKAEGCIADREKEEFLQKFHQMILGIEVAKYENFEKHFSAFWHKHGSHITRLALWSQGDVNSTGYQTVKLYKSGLFRDLGRVVGKKMDYLISEDKFRALHDYFDHIKGLNGKAKIVVIDDIPKNLEKANSLITNILPGAEIIQVYAGYNRRIQKLRKTDPELYDRLMSKPTTIRSFGELAEKPEFDKIFENALVLLDVDGVILDNQKTGEKMGEIFYRLAEEQVKSTSLVTLENMPAVLQNVLSADQL